MVMLSAVKPSFTKPSNCPVTAAADPVITDGAVAACSPIRICM